MNPLFTAATDSSAPRVGVIAELGVNHDGDPAIALALIDAAADAGADAVKVQLFHPDRLLSNQARLAAYQAGSASSQHELLTRLAMGVEQLHPVAQRARERHLAFIATVFSPGDAHDLAALGPDAVKIASPDAVNPPLLRAAAALDRPLLISTGTCDLEELAFAADLLRGHAPGGALLHCVSAYPTPRHAAGLGAIRVMAETFGLPVGYSDHTTDLDTGALAVAAGAVVLEKHLTHDKTAPGPDHAASLTPDQLAIYVANVRDAQRVLGPAAKRTTDLERDVRLVSRQSICPARDLPAGHLLTAADLTVRRPGTGIPAAALTDLIGRRLACDVTAGDLLAHDQLTATTGNPLKTR